MKNKINKLQLIGLSPNSKLMKEYKAQLPALSELQYNALIGLILGDASINSQNRGKTHRIKFEYSNKSKEYIDHICMLFDDFIISPPHLKTRISPKNPDVKIFNWGFQTLQLSQFNTFAELFGVSPKRVPKNLIQDHLTDVGLAYWYMDDGGKWDYNKGSKNRSVVLHTQGFSIEDVTQMVVELNTKFDLQAYRHFNRDKPIIIIPSKSFDLFYNLVSPFILNIKCMRHKLFLD